VANNTDADTPTIEVDPSQPLPAISLTLNAADDGVLLQLHTDNFAMRPNLPDAPNLPNMGFAHLHVNDDRIVPIYGETIAIPQAWLGEGENNLWVALNAMDGALWTYAGGEIGAEIAFEMADSLPIASPIAPVTRVPTIGTSAATMAGRSVLS